MCSAVLLVREPMLKHCNGGSLMGWFTVASNHRYKDKTGTVQEDPAFVACKVFGGWAEALENCHKGEMILVSGRFRTESWEKNGAKQSQLTLICDSVHRVASGGNASRTREPVIASGQDANEELIGNGKPPF